MGQYGVSLRAWAVIVCLHVAVVCVEADGFGSGFGVSDGASKHVQEAKGKVLDTLFEEVDDDEDGSNSAVMARGKKKKKLKYLLAVIIGIVIVKVVLIPIALKAVAVLAKKAFLLSALSLVLSALLGFKRIAEGGWDRMGQMMVMKERGEVTELPYHPMPTEAMYHKISTDQYWGRDFRSK